VASEPLYVAYPHPVVHLGAYVGVALLGLAGAGVLVLLSPAIGLALLLVCGLSLVMVEVSRRTSRLALYADGIAREYRLLSTRRTFAEYESVQDLDMTQTFLERLAGVGTLHVNTAGSEGKEIVFAGIARCHEVEEAIREKMRPDRVDTPESGNVR